MALVPYEPEPDFNQRYGPIPRLQDWRLGSENDDVLKELRECEMTHRDPLIFVLIPANYLFIKINDS